MLIGKFSRALEGKPKRKKNITGNIKYQSVRDKARRACEYSPEVVIKITGYGQRPGNALANLGYISRTDKDAEFKGKEPLELETDRGEILSGKEAIREFAEGWESDFGKPNKRRRDTVKMMLSMPPGTNTEAVKDATREFAWQNFAGRHEYVFVLHTDEPHPHCHLTVKMLGHDGTRLNIGPEDLAKWREQFAQALRDRGVDAHATRRAARGVVRKAESSVVRQIADNPRKGKTRVPKVVALRERDAAQELIAEQQGKPLPPRPWEPKIRAEQEAVRSAWLAAADELERGPALRLLPADHLDQVRRAQRHTAAYQARLATPKLGEAPHPITGLDALASMGAVPLLPARRVRNLVDLPTLASVRSVQVGACPGSPSPVFLPEDYHARVRQSQQSGAAYQAQIAAPRDGEPPHPVAPLSAIPTIKPVPYQAAVIWRQRRPLDVRTLAGVPRLAYISSPQARAQSGRIPPPPVFRQESHHERPRFSLSQQSAAVYQSNLAARGEERPGPVRRLCDLSGLDVVRNNAAQVLLQPDALDRLGWRAGADRGLRWSGAGPDGDRAGAGRESGTQGPGSANTGRPQGGVEGGRTGTHAGAVRGGGATAAGANVGAGRGAAGIVKLSDVTSSAASDKALAQDIRAFVAAMPAVETTRDVLKRELAARFPAKQVQQVPAPPATGQEKGADQAAPKGMEPGL
jgi:hypothetical protein